MTDLHARFRALDSMPAPDLWHEIESGARSSRIATASPAQPAWIAIAIVLALTVAVTGAVLLGSRLFPLPETPVPSGLPSPSDGPSPTQGPDAGDRPGWKATDPTLQERRAPGYTVTLLADGRVLVASAPVGNQASSDDQVPVTAEVFDPERGSWSRTLPMNELRFDHTATLMRDGRVLVTGGAYLGRSESSAEIFDPRTGAWTPTASMREARDHHTATLLTDGRVLVAGGGSRETYHEGERQPTASAELYDPDAGTWSAAASMLAPHTAHTATLLQDGRVLVIPTGGGSWEVGAPDAGDAEIYDPVSGSWSAIPYDPVEFHTATLLRDGRVLVVGGDWRDGEIRTGTASLFDPRTRTWTRAADTLAPRGWHTATLLLDGTVLVAGAGDGGYGGSTAAEVFDPDRGTWTRVPDMIGGHAEHAAVALADGRVLMVGGYGSNSTPEVYDPGGED